MSDANVVKLLQPGSFADPLTEVLRNGARALLAQAIEAEVAEFLDAELEALRQLFNDDGQVLSRMISRHVSRIREQEGWYCISHVPASLATRIYISSLFALVPPLAFCVTGLQWIRFAENFSSATGRSALTLLISVIWFGVGAAYTYFFDS